MSARVRAHDVLDIALGTVVTDPSTTLWVFCGWAEVTAGKSAVFGPFNGWPSHRPGVHVVLQRSLHGHAADEVPRPRAVRESVMMVRVFEMPDLRTHGFLHGGGAPSVFVQVDWFCDDRGIAASAGGRARLEDFIKRKRYFDPQKAYLVLHPTHPFTIGYAVP